MRDIDADLILTTGGTSVGIRDLVPEAVRKLGKLLVHGIAISPAKPTALGLVENTPIACLPGFPVACLVASYAFVKPAIHRLAHVERTFERTVTGTLAVRSPENPARERMREWLSGTDASNPLWCLDRAYSALWLKQTDSLSFQKTSKDMMRVNG